MYWPPTGLLGVCIELPQPPRVDAVGADRYADGSPCRTVSYIAMGLTHQQSVCVCLSGMDGQEARDWSLSQDQASCGDGVRRVLRSDRTQTHTRSLN